MSPIESWLIVGGIVIAAALIMEIIDYIG